MLRVVQGVFSAVVFASAFLHSTHRSPSSLQVKKGGVRELAEHSMLFTYQSVTKGRTLFGRATTYQRLPTLRSRSATFSKQKETRSSTNTRRTRTTITLLRKLRQSMTKLRIASCRNEKASRVRKSAANRFSGTPKARRKLLVLSLTQGLSLQYFASLTTPMSRPMLF